MSSPRTTCTSTFDALGLSSGPIWYRRDACAVFYFGGTGVQVLPPARLGAKPRLDRSSARRVSSGGPSAEYRLEYSTCTPNNENPRARKASPGIYAGRGHLCPFPQIILYTYGYSFHTAIRKSRAGGLKMRVGVRLILEGFSDMPQAVVGNWEKGNLAAAINDLRP